MGSTLRGVGAVLVVVFVWTAVASARSPNPGELIVGHWQTAERLPDRELSMRMEFTRNSVRINFGGASVAGPYRWIDAQTIEVMITDPDSNVRTERSTVQVTDKELTITGADGHPIKFTRVK